ncbi:hypothetical protein [Pseudonocardia alni]
MLVGPGHAIARWTARLAPGAGLGSAALTGPGAPPVSGFTAG